MTTHQRSLWLITPLVVAASVCLFLAVAAPVPAAPLAVSGSGTAGYELTAIHVSPNALPVLQRLSVRYLPDSQDGMMAAAARTEQTTSIAARPGRSTNGRFGCTIGR